MIVAHEGHHPQVAPGAWVAPNATLVGRVTVEAGASIWYGVVVRADRESIRIGPGSNVQDGCVLHADPGSPVDIGTGVTVGHSAVVHGARIEDGALVGMGAVVLNGAVVGAGALVAAASLVPEGMHVPPGTLVAGVPARVRRDLSPEESDGLARSATTYAVLREEHRTAHEG
jgi:carbonic anhydrase/acetyltransferase-like protein (isoleucine patch superfamily)